MYVIEHTKASASLTDAGTEGKAITEWWRLTYRMQIMPAQSGTNISITVCGTIQNIVHISCTCPSSTPYVC